MRRFELQHRGIGEPTVMAEGVEFDQNRLIVRYRDMFYDDAVQDFPSEKAMQEHNVDNYGQELIVCWFDLPPALAAFSEGIAKGMEAGLKSGIRQVSPIELAFAKLETAGAKGALYQSEKERVKLELELAEASAAVERQDALLEKWGKVLVERDAEIARLKESRKLAEERHVAISDTLAERDAKIERLGKALADANERSIAYQQENETLRAKQTVLLQQLTYYVATDVERIIRQTSSK